MCGCSSILSFASASASRFFSLGTCLIKNSNSEQLRTSRAWLKSFISAASFTLYSPFNCRTISSLSEWITRLVHGIPVLLEKSLTCFKHSMSAVYSATLLVTFPRNFFSLTRIVPDSSFSTTPTPPGPGLPRAAPSVKPMIFKQPLRSSGRVPRRSGFCRNVRT